MQAFYVPLHKWFSEGVAGRRRNWFPSFGALTEADGVVRRQRRGSASLSDESQSFVRLPRCVIWPGRVLLFVFWSPLTPSLLLSELCLCAQDLLFSGLRSGQNGKIHVSLSSTNKQMSNTNLSECNVRQFYSVAAFSHFILTVLTFVHPCSLGG